MLCAILLKSDKKGQTKGKLSVIQTPAILKTPPTTHYSQLRYETTSPSREGKVRCFYLEQELSYKAFARDLLGDIWKLLKWFSRLPGKKEVVIAVMMLIGFLPHIERVYAAPLPQHEAPYYLQPISRLQPVKAVAFTPPATLQPVAAPSPPSPPVAVPVVASAPAAVSSGCVTGVTVANYYENLLIQRESSGNSCANNGSCVGILQACPSSKLYAVCPTLEVSCQLNFFEGYMSSTYGSWANAWAQDEARYPHWW